MLINLLLGIPTMILCLFLQSVLVIVALYYYTHRKRLIDSPSFTSSLLVLNGVMLILIIGNLAQVAIWSLLFQLLGEFERFDAAFYHSAVNFATLGYGDIVMSDQHKLLGPVQAINGVLMIGVSTATLMATFHDALKKTIQARRS
jgi:hypothetical protein